jgi:putative hemolysin
VLIGLTVKSKRMPDWLVNGIGAVFNHVLGFTQFNQLYAELPEHKDIELSGAFLETLNIDLELQGEPLKSYPTDGPLIFVANHPHGLLDGFALDHLLTKIRPDGFLMGTYVLGEIPEYSERLILVDPFKKRKRKSLNVKSWRQVYRLMANAGALVIFPAGAVSHYHWARNEVTDRDWNPHIATLARRTQANVVPIFIHGRNSLSFQICGMISTKLQNLLIFKELPKMKNRKLQVTLGKSMPTESWSGIKDDKDLINHFRKEVEALAKT